MDNIVIGITYSLFAGLFITLQSVFNTRISDKVGLWETTVIVHVVGLIFGLLMTIIVGKGSFKDIGQVNKIYLIGGVLGVMIVYSVMIGITSLGASLSIAIVVTTQLIFATIVDSFGLFGSPQIEFNFTKFLGILIMIIGIIIFKSK